MVSLDDLEGIERIMKYLQQSKCHEGEQIMQSLHLYWQLELQTPWLISQSVDTCAGTPISKGVSSHMTEYASAGGPSYSETVGPISDDITEDYPGSKKKGLRNFKENLLVFLDSLILECQDGPVFD